MYKKVLKNIKIAKTRFVDSLYKSESNSILGRKPHFIFAADNPLYPDKQRLKMSPENVLDLLQRKGYKAEAAQGKYGNEESSIVVHNPAPHTIKHLFKLSSDLGQESSIYSNGHEHELHYHHGPNAGKYNKGQGTTIHKKPPEDHYTTTNDGTHFSHVFDFDTLHEPETSMLKQKPTPVNKSEGPYRFKLAKNENSHPLETAMPDTKLVHYSKRGDLEEIDPRFMGTGTKDATLKYSGQPDNPVSYHYLEGTKPEALVTGGSTHKYTSSLGDKKLYDIGKDPDGIAANLKQKAANRQINPGTYTRDEFDKAVIEAGYHGIYNSGLDNTMRNVVGLYGKVKPDLSHKIHPNDHDEASSKDHHAEDERREKAKKFSQENGHDHDFLHNLAESFRDKYGK